MLAKLANYVFGSNPPYAGYSQIGNDSCINHLGDEVMNVFEVE